MLISEVTSGVGLKSETNVPSGKHPLRLNLIVSSKTFVIERID